MPAPPLSAIKTIVIVMLENRSFDHMLGYRSLARFSGLKLEGLKDDAAWNTQVANPYNGAQFPLWHWPDPFGPMLGDPPHERENIALNLGAKTAAGYAMDGFVENYGKNTKGVSVHPGDRVPVMGYFTPPEVPMSHFLADNFAICDQWFSAIPAGTQPNRLMAMSGFTRIDRNSSLLLPNQPLLYDWLTENKIRWRVYHQGLPFFALMERWIGPVLEDDEHFRRFTSIADDLMEELPDELPQVFFFEPAYTDAPHIGISTDDHAPSAAKGGQEFMHNVYKAFATLNPDIWNQMVMIITYDEHGGFFDHVSPPALTTLPPAGALYKNPFISLGVRVPAFIVSPFVKPGTVFPKALDHTSILKFVSQVFGKGTYNNEVDHRTVGSVYDVLNQNSADVVPPAPPPIGDYLKKVVPSVGYTPGKAPHNETAESFKKSLDQMKAHSHSKTAAKFGDAIGPFAA
jgi:phospholipase C